MASQGLKGCPGVPTSAQPGKCSCVWTFIHEALTYHRWGVESSFSGTLGAISPGGYGVSCCRVSAEMGPGVGIRQAWAGRLHSLDFWL